MKTKTWLISVSVSVELPEELVDDDMPKPELLHDIPDVVTAALGEHLASTPEAKVNWESMQVGPPLDDMPNVGRCAICNCWVFDAENRTEYTPPINPGAVVDGHLFCDEHLPEDHPIAF